MDGRLPIDDARKELEDALALPSPRILLKAPTGSGKSTRVPVFMDEAGWGRKGVILVVQPRRIAARMLARYVARQTGGEVGGKVGYVVRFEKSVSKETRIIYLTDGMLQRWLMTDRMKLEGVSAVVFDEFHERSLAGDLCLGRTLHLQETARPDLAVVVMSATIEMKGLREYLGGSCKAIEAQGRMFPVDVEYRPPRIVADKRGTALPPAVWEQAAEAVRAEVGREDCGDVLVFMPGVFEIRKTVELLESKSWMKGREVYALHGALSPEAQNRAVDEGMKPRVIVSTNVAETSLTIQGVRTVVDSGLVRHAGWDARRGMNTLLIEKISRSSADQRTGRAGRVAPGRCVRLWSQADHLKRAEFDVPEVLRVDLSETVLVLKFWGVDDVMRFGWLDLPSPGVLDRSLELLGDLGALEKRGGLSAVGRAMLQFPLEPRLSRMLVHGKETGCVPEAAAVAALLQGEQVEMRCGLDESFREKGDYTDFQAEWRAVQKAAALNYEPGACGRLGIMGRAAREVVSAYRQILGISKFAAGRDVLPDFTERKDDVVRCVVRSFSDHAGVRNGIAAGTCRLAGGKSGKLPSCSVAMKGLAFVAAEVSEIGGRGVETRIGRCTLIEPEVLRECFADDFSSEDVAVFDESRRRVVLRRRTIFRDLVLEDADKGDAEPEQAAPILAAKVADGTLKLNKWDDSVDQWIRRLNGFARWMPEMEMPTFSDDDRVVAFAALCEGAAGYKDIKDREIMPVLREWLSGWQMDAMEKYAPVSLKLSNGQQAKVRYEEDSTPVISLMVQRLFGVAETPAIMGGKCPVKVEILAPNQRPWQVTSSLHTFWESGYIQMRKDLAGRYPRHKWPEKP